MTLQPQTPQEVQELVQAHSGLLPVGGGSKPALSTPPNGATPLAMSHLTGIIEYEPDEYTFTALAGTPLAEVAAELASHGQYLPFDPLLAAQGATLGGTVAANTSGSGRFRYGGVRDFILGARFVDGRGQLVRGGGKVVKNAAGFDLPKFFTGSLGRFGVLVELTFKVFPQPRAYITLQADYAGLAEVLQTTFTLANKPFELDALNLQPQPDGAVRLLLRVGGLPNALPDRIQRLQQFLSNNTSLRESAVLEGEAEAALWAAFNGLLWADAAHTLVKVPVAPRQLPALDAVDGLTGRHYSAAGNVAWLTATDVDALDARLDAQGLAGLVLRGSPGRPIIGRRKGALLAQRVKQALDPDGKFLEA
ncbi:MAG: FAD-binding protein [Anaerolineae bacterium]